MARCMGVRASVAAADCRSIPIAGLREKRIAANSRGQIAKGQELSFMPCSQKLCLG